MASPSISSKVLSEILPLVVIMEIIRFLLKLKLSKVFDSRDKYLIILGLEQV